MYNNSHADGNLKKTKQKKHALHRIYFFNAACVQTSCRGKKIYRMKTNESVSMPSDISYANSFCSDVQYVNLCTDAAEGNVDKYVVYL